MLVCQPCYLYSLNVNPPPPKEEKEKEKGWLLSNIFCGSKIFFFWHILSSSAEFQPWGPSAQFSACIFLTQCYFFWWRLGCNIWLPILMSGVVKLPLSTEGERRRTVTLVPFYCLERYICVCHCLKKNTLNRRTL